MRVFLDWERLEYRQVLSTFYDLSVIASTAGGQFSSFGDSVAINNRGQVAFVGNTAQGSGLWVDSPLFVPSLDNINPSWSDSAGRNFGRAAAINDLGQVTARDRENGLDYVRSWTESTHDQMRIVASANSLTQPDYGKYASLQTFADINEAGDVAFAALTPDSDYFLVQRTRHDTPAETSETISQIPLRDAQDNLVPGPRPQLTDDARVLVRNASGELILKTTIDQGEKVASGFREMGAAPGVSGDGNLVVFVGDRGRGRGVFVAYRSAGGWQIQHIAGEGLDGMTFPDLNAAVRVNNTAAVERGVTVAFEADHEPGDGATALGPGLYTVRLGLIGARPDQFSPTAVRSIIVNGATPVVLKGDRVGASTVDDVQLWDGINDESLGQVAFWAHMSDGSQAVIRGTARPVLYIDFNPLDDAGTLATPANRALLSEVGIASDGWGADFDAVVRDLKIATDPASYRTGIVDRVEDMFREHAADTNLKVLGRPGDARPATVPLTVVDDDGDPVFADGQPIRRDAYATVYVGGAPRQPNGQVTLLGQAAAPPKSLGILDFYNQILGDTAVVFADAALATAVLGRPAPDVPESTRVEAIAATIAHEAGHTFGLIHLEESLIHDLMHKATVAGEFDQQEGFYQTPTHVDPDLFPSGLTPVEHSAPRLQFALGRRRVTIDDPEPPDPRLLQLGAGDVLRKAGVTLSGPPTHVARLVMGVVRAGLDDQLPDWTDLGSGDLADLLAGRSWSVRQGDRWILIGSTDGRTADLVAVSPGAGTLEGLTLSGLGVSLDARLRTAVGPDDLALSLRRWSGASWDEIGTLTLTAPTPGITIDAPEGGLITGEDGAAARIAVVLNAPPTATVTIPVASTAPTEGVASVAQLVFTPGDWDVPQFVVVTGQADAIADGDVDYSIVLGAARSIDARYGGLDPEDVPATNRDRSVGRPQVSGVQVLDVTAGQARVRIDFTVAMAAGPAGDPGNYVVSQQAGDGRIVRAAQYADEGELHRTILTVDLNGADGGSFRLRVNGRRLVDRDGISMADAIDELFVSSGANVTVDRLGKTPDGVGLLAAPINLAGPANISRLDRADLNGDGIDDLLLVGSPLLVAFGRAGGGFGGPVAVLPSDAIAGPAYPVDWDGDGTTDIAVVGFTQVAVYLNDGSAHFALAPEMPVPLPGDLSGRIGAFADFNGDGRMDIVVGAYHRAFSGYQDVDGPVDDGGVILITKDRFVGYTVAATLQHKPPGVGAEQFPQQLVVGDFNGDGRPDLVVANSGFYYLNPHSVAILLNSAAGLQPAQTVPTTNYNVARIAAADFDGDGTLDVVAVHERYRNSEDEQIGIVEELLSGDGKGGFTVHPFQELHSRSMGLLTAGDLNGDGRPDLVFSDTGGVWSWLNDGTGTFVPSTSATVPFDASDTTDATSAILVDINGDGRPDLYASGGAIAAGRALINDGRGTLRPDPSRDIAPGRWVAPGARQNGLVVADFNRDGRPDVATLDNSTGPQALLVHLGDANGDPGAFRATALADQRNAAFWPDVVADFNEDGYPDLLVGTLPLLGRGDGTFARGTPFDASGELSAVQAADVNGDGHVDLVVGVRNANAYYVCFGDGTGTFVQNINTKLSVNAGYAGADGELFGFTLGDFDGDGKLDLLHAQINGQVQLFRGNGNGTFAASPIASLTGVNIATVAAADFNGDGKLDLVGLNHVYHTDDYASVAHVLSGDGTGRFTLATTVNLAGQPSQVQVGDFDGDGSTDLAVEMAQYLARNDVVSVALNDGAAHFRTQEVATGAASLFAGTWRTPAYIDAGTFTVSSVSFETAQPARDEHGGPIELVVTRRGDLSGTATVRYATADGSAKATADYIPTSGVLTFAPGESRKTIAVDIVDDATVEPDKSFTLSLSQPGAGLALGPDPTAVVAILNDDVPPPPSPGRAFRLSAPSGTTFTEAGVRSLRFRVDRLGGSAGVVSVAFATADGTALAGSDYDATSGVLTFQDGESEKAIDLSIRDDADFEVDEQFGLALSDPNGGPSIEGTGALALTIVSDEGGSIFRLTPRDATTFDEGSLRTLQVRVGRLGSTAGSASVSYNTADGTALAGSDYNASSGVLNFAPGEAEKILTLSVLADALTEPIESFDLVLHDPTGGAAIDPPGRLTFAIKDPDGSVLLAPLIDARVDEGQPFTTVALARSSIPGRALVYSLLPGSPAGASIAPSSGIVTWTPPDGTAASTYQVGVRVADAASPDRAAEGTFRITVANVAPHVTLSPVGDLAPGSPLSGSGAFTDPGADTWTGTVDYGDGTGPQPLALSPDKKFSLSHTYQAAGDYRVTATVIDKDGGVGRTSFAVRVIAHDLGRPVILLSAPIFAGGTTRRPAVQTITLSFDGVIYLDPGAIELVGGPGKKARPIAISSSASIVDGRTALTLSFANKKRVLKDGKYVLTLHAVKTRDAQGRPLDGNADGAAGGDWSDPFRIVRGRQK